MLIGRPWVWNFTSRIVAIHRMPCEHPRLGALLATARSLKVLRLEYRLTHPFKLLRRPFATKGDARGGIFRHPYAFIDFTNQSTLRIAHGSRSWPAWNSISCSPLRQWSSRKAAVFDGVSSQS